ncbi:MAG: outer membrane protein assembly factor BamE [Gammaproteobacteria bacterium]|nr:outer membrane protein assembly factor BamE [Gammaproteobacteria bacterium]
MDIPQGNQIDPKKLEQLKTGMTKSQVEFLLGSAAINDHYHANQAHYVYYRYNGKDQTTELKKMILTYDADVLVNIEGDLN